MGNNKKLPIIFPSGRKFHLLTSIDDKQYRYVKPHDNFLHLTVLVFDRQCPLFFDSKDQLLKIAIHFTIQYPKIYVTKAIDMEKKFLPLIRGFIH